ncbi:MAG: UDP-glucose--hexose-1-phosphate uridylyltransferase [Oscillospiraceae bacterium]|nr:UDP-glucose--hexose-1-phosphate uridylyltransferase [Oscillospiraceae bacterium]
MIAYEIERLLTFGCRTGLMEEEDVIPVRNALLDLFGVVEPCPDEVAYEAETATEVLEQMLDYAVENGLIKADTLTQRDLFAARIMGLLMPRQSEIVRSFWAKHHKSPEVATDAFYALSRASNYIQVDRVKKNAHWIGETAFGALEITINLSKPEKDPQDIAAAKHAPTTTYPKCLLCKENVGFAGTYTHPARQNHRIIPLTLNEEPWYFQYSPYVYYNEHCIVLDAVHRPMQIGAATFRRLFDFVSQFPHYFIGSNADLPIVGGSILNHDHFQGGRHVFPMERAAADQDYAHPMFADIQVAVLKWPMSVIRIAGTESEELVRLATFIFDGWKAYSAPEVEILSHTEDTPHNTVTPIVRVNQDGLFEMDIVLRNNRTSEAHPHGIFHPHAHLHHIKKENIGLIEVMGLAVLPPRLQTELDGLQGEEKQRFKQEITDVFAEVLENAGVFKWDLCGRTHFNAFMQTLGFERL